MKAERHNLATAEGNDGADEALLVDRENVDPSDGAMINAVVLPTGCGCHWQPSWILVV